MKNHCYLLLAICTLFISSCKKDNHEEPSATGAGTLTATNYGFDSNGSAGKFSSTKLGITQNTTAGITVFALSAIKDGSNESISIIVNRKIATTGKITFVYNDSSNGGITYSKDYTKPAHGTLNYKTDASNSTTKGGGELNITKFDGDKIEGTFNFVAINANGKEAWAENHQSIKRHRLEKHLCQS